MASFCKPIAGLCLLFISAVERMAAAYLAKKNVDLDWTGLECGSIPFPVDNLFVYIYIVLNQSETSD